MANEKLTTPVGRVSFPQIWQPKANDKGDKIYSLSLIFNREDLKNDPAERALFDKLQSAVLTEVNKKWGSKANIPHPFTNPFKDGKVKEKFGGYGDDTIYIDAKTKEQPGIVAADRDAETGRPRIIKDHQEFYAGCWARITVNAYPWTFMGKCGISFGLQNIQKVDDDEPFGGRGPADADFDAISEVRAPQTPDSAEGPGVDPLLDLGGSMLG